MHGKEDPGVALLTLGEPLDASLAWMLVDAGLGVLTFDAFDDARSAIEEKIAGLVLIDSRAPDARRLDAVARVRALAPEIPVLDARPDAVRLDGVDAVLTPPFEAVTVVGVVAPLLAAYHQRLDELGE